MLFNTFVALLSVSALQVRVNPGSVTEGQSVTLTCNTTCTLTGSPAFTWYRDGSALSFTTQTHQLTASSEDGGTYSCAVKGSELLPSLAVALTVNSLQVRVNPGSVIEGQSVTLTCTTCTLTGSPAFTWYRDGSPLSFTTQTHQLTASSEDGGTYSCAVKGSELLPSPAVALTVYCEYKRPDSCVSHYW
ncbi:hypothetical protein COCON_G00001210 [Conger conger]|uniref:Ig-like domain-containing protein n=1 Tax=Conger conger TaxID=82655 RepID=A0A9Q1E0N5_CONCO|nr:hypothetical protein COCON_G00001210 [Conger conger]